MAQLLSIATGNASNASTWGLVDATSFNSSTETATVLTTSRVGATTFTPGAITIIGIAVKLAVRTGTTGTITVDLDQGGSAVSGTTVTINVADLPVAATADLNGGWHFFKFASAVTLAAATAYSVKCKTSSSSQVSLFATATSNWCRCLVTSTTQAPASGDNMIVCGEYLSAGSSNTYTVTWDITATTDFGNTPTAANSLLAAGICVCNKGVLTSGTTSSTNYNMKMSNSIIVYSGGVFKIGDTGAEIPRNSTFTLQVDCGANVDYGITVRNLGTFKSIGLSRTSGYDTYFCKLNTDEAVNSTSLGVDTDTKWLDNDEIVIASTVRNETQCEIGALNGAAGASSLTVDGFAGVSGGIANAHSGSSPIQAEIILLSRNIKIIGASATLQSYIRIDPTAIVDIQWTEIKWMGSATSNKLGINIKTTSGTCNFEYCSFRNFEVASSVGTYLEGTTGSGVTFLNNVYWKIHSGFITVAATTGVPVFDGNICIKTENFSASIVGVLLNDIGLTFTNNTIAGCVTDGIRLAENNKDIGTFSGNTIHSCSSTASTGGMNISGNITGGTISDLKIWRSGGSTYGGLRIGSNVRNVTFLNLTLFGNNVGNITLSGGGILAHCLFDNLFCTSESSFPSVYGIYISSIGAAIIDSKIINSDIGNNAGFHIAHAISDIEMTTITDALILLKLINTYLRTATEINLYTNLSSGSYISSQTHDQTAGNHKLWKKYGIISIDTTEVYSGTYSMKMTPNSASNKLQSIGPDGCFEVEVASGQTCTPTIWIAEGGTYNGNRVRLLVKRNDDMGITYDTVLATATGYGTLTWQSLSGTTAAATANGVLEFFVDCDGTVGSVYVDKISAIVT